MVKRIASFAVPIVSAAVAGALTFGIAHAMHVSGKRVRTAVSNIGTAHATDHNDGDFGGKVANVDLTDHFAFREDTRTNDADGVNRIVFGQLSNPSLAYGVEAPFNTTALYEIHVSRVLKANREEIATGSDDVIFRFQFTKAAAPQNILLTVLDQGVESFSGTTGTGGAFTTTTLAGAAAPTENTLVTSKGNLTFFAGVRRDPAAHDRARFDLVRDYAIDRFITGNVGAQIESNCIDNPTPLTPINGTTANFFNPVSCATNSYATRNISAIVLTVPVTFLQSDPQQTLFDSWSTTSLPTESLKGFDDAR